MLFLFSVTVHFAASPVLKKKKKKELQFGLSFWFILISVRKFKFLSGWIPEEISCVVT